MEAIADRVIGLLGSVTSKELDLICNFQDDLDSMKSMVTAIKALLLDAERKATKSHQTNDWLQKLKDLLFDAEDLLDAYSSVKLAREVMTKDKRAKEVRIFFSKNNRIVCAAKMGRQIRAIRKKLDGIFNEKNNLHLSEISSIASVESYDWRQTHSFMREEDVVGRDNERMQLVDILLNLRDVESDVSVVAIVGIGGLGKTTLAQQVYNDEAVINHFELMRWVCVSDESGEFNTKRIAQNITRKEYGAMDQVAQGLREMIEGKLFLLVLDDVWNEHRQKWLELESLLRGGKRGSMIIVTTRSEKVAQIMGTPALLKLNDLNFENSWELFRRMAFRERKEPDNQELVGIGKDIVRKYAGVPLAIRTIGSLLFTKKLGVSEWSYFRDNELANIDSEDNKIFSILKLSYDHLPSYLKNCFAFCSLFPKDYNIERKTLIQLWIAKGYIQLLDNNRLLEDVGNEYFDQLLSRCLFQDVKEDGFGDIESCKMHDLIHDLAHSITKNEYYLVTSERIKEEKLGDRIRHVSSYYESNLKFPFGNINTKKIRTILSLEGQWEFVPTHSWSRFFNPICGSTTTSLTKHLCVLALRNQDLEIPETIGDLKHLRYLELSNNQVLEKLPRGITKLHNLLTLKLNGCRHLIELPCVLKRLVRLRHLELDYSSNLMCMPRGLGGLTIGNLRHLYSEFYSKRLLESIRSLTSLQELFIEHCPSLASLPESIGNLTSLQTLYLPCCNSLASLPESIGNLTLLQKLDLPGCCSLASLPESIGNLTSLQKLDLPGCCSLTSLPESIGNLTSLRNLDLPRCCSLASLSESIGNLTSLQKLDFSYCTSLTSLPESIGNLTLLQMLSLYDCTSLASLPESIGNLTSLQTLCLSYCTSLASLLESIGNLTSLKTLHLFDCASLASLPESIGRLTSLSRLDLSNCTSLASLLKSIGRLTSLQMLNLSDCTSLANARTPQMHFFGITSKVHWKSHISAIAMPRQLRFFGITSRVHWKSHITVKAITL